MCWISSLSPILLVHVELFTQCCIGIYGATCIHGIIINMGIKKPTTWV